MSEKGHRISRSQPGKHNKEEDISHSSYLNKPDKLHESENTWNKEAEYGESTKMKELYEKVDCILSKLNPQNSDVLVKQMKDLEIDTEEQLNGVLDLILGKAIDEPNFSVLYANMCKQLMLKAYVPSQPLINPQNQPHEISKNFLVAALPPAMYVPNSGSMMGASTQYHHLRPSPVTSMVQQQQINTPMMNTLQFRRVANVMPNMSRNAMGNISQGLPQFQHMQMPPPTQTLRHGVIPTQPMVYPTPQVININLYQPAVIWHPPQYQQQERYPQMFATVPPNYNYPSALNSATYYGYPHIASHQAPMTTNMPAIPTHDIKKREKVLLSIVNRKTGLSIFEDPENIANEDQKARTDFLSSQPSETPYVFPSVSDANPAPSTSLTTVVQPKAGDIKQNSVVNGNEDGKLFSQSPQLSSEAVTLSDDNSSVIDKDSESMSDDSEYSLTEENEENQWSPLNPAGKKFFDREFLLQPQSPPLSLQKLTNSLNLDVIKNKPNGSIPRECQPSSDNKQKMISFLRSLNQSVNSCKSENAWNEGGDEGESTRTEELYKKVHGIINKLTPENFDTLAEQVKDLEINTEEQLIGIVDLVFEKAVNEPNFVVHYANMCKQLATVNIHLNEGERQVSFKNLLLTKCQREFEQDRSNEISMVMEKQIKETDGCKTVEKIMQLDYQKKEQKNRRRRLGNIRFIGELFKLGMLIEPIMHECVENLLNQGDEDSLECLCCLLTTIGRDLVTKRKSESNKEYKQKKNMMNNYLAQMQKIIDKHKTSSRVRFMIQNVIDLKKRNWVPRRNENNTKTIDQIRKKAGNEAQDQQQMLQNMTFPKKLTDRQKSAKSGRVTSSKTSKVSVDASKLQLTRPTEVDSIQLGPSSEWDFSNLGWGSSGESKTSSIDNKPPSAVYTNRSVPPSRESSRVRNNKMPPNIRKTPSSKERELA